MRRTRTFVAKAFAQGLWISAVERRGVKAGVGSVAACLSFSDVICIGFCETSHSLCVDCLVTSCATPIQV